MDEWVERLNAAIHNLRKPRHVADVDNGNARLAKGFHGSARRNNLNACLMQCACERHDTALI